MPWRRSTTSGDCERPSGEASSADAPARRTTGLQAVASLEPMRRKRIGLCSPQSEGICMMPVCSCTPTHVSSVPVGRSRESGRTGGRARPRRVRRKAHAGTGLVRPSRRRSSRGQARIRRSSCWACVRSRRHWSELPRCACAACAQSLPCLLKSAAVSLCHFSGDGRKEGTSQIMTSGKQEEIVWALRNCTYSIGGGNGCVHDSEEVLDTQLHASTVLTCYDVTRSQHDRPVLGADIRWWIESKELSTCCHERHLAENLTRP